MSIKCVPCGTCVFSHAKCVSSRCAVLMYVIVLGVVKYMWRMNANSGGVGAVTGKARKVEQYRRVAEKERVRDLGRLETFKRQAALIAAMAQQSGLSGNMDARATLTSFADESGGGGGVGGGGFLMTPVLGGGGFIPGGEDGMLGVNGGGGGGTVESGGTKGELNVLFSMANEMGGESSIVRALNDSGEVSGVGGGGATSSVVVPVGPSPFERFVSFIQKHRVTCICNVYQEVYMGGKKATGLGDFIRGCYYVIQFCRWLSGRVGGGGVGVMYSDMLIIHKLRDVLQRAGAGAGAGAIMSSIAVFSNQNWIRTEFAKDGTFKDETLGAAYLDMFMEYVMQSGVIYNGTVFVYTIAYPLWPIAGGARDIIRRGLCGSVDMENYVARVQSELGLVRGGYIVIHVRCGDQFLIGGGAGSAGSDSGVISGLGDGRFNSEYIGRLLSAVGAVVAASTKEGHATSVLLIADNNEVKDHIVGRFPQFRAMKKAIGHFGEGETQSDDKIRNTMLDFYLMGRSAGVYSFTVYAHGSGFSRWCAETYGVPYRCWTFRR